MDLPGPLIAIVGDLLPVMTEVPFGSALVESVHLLIDGRRRQARDILIDELRYGQAIIERIEDLDELAAVFLKYI